MGQFVRVAALCAVAELAIAKVITVSEGLCSTDLPAPTYGWVSTNGSSIPYSFPPTSTSTPPSASLPVVYPTPSSSGPSVIIVTPIPAPSSSADDVPPVYSTPSSGGPTIDPVYTSSSSVPPVSLPSPIPSSTSDTPFVPPVSSPPPDDAPTSSSTTSIFSYITPTQSNPPIVAPTPDPTGVCTQTAPQGATIQCDATDGLTFCQGGQNFGLRCGIHYDLITMSDIIFSYSAEECLDTCLGTVGCTAIEFSSLYNNCVLAYGIFGVTGTVDPYMVFLYNRGYIDDDYIPQNICPFGGCTEQPLS